MGEPSRQPGSLMRAWAIGLDFAGSVGGGALLGLLVDWLGGTGPWGLVGGLLVGLIVGAYRFVREGLAAQRRG